MQHHKLRRFSKSVIALVCALLYLGCGWHFPLEVSCYPWSTDTEIIMYVLVSFLVHYAQHRVKSTSVCDGANLKNKCICPDRSYGLFLTCR
jgi:hypothetical protein